MLRNTELLIGHLHVALPMASIRAGFYASDESGLWAMATQELQGQPTGKIVLVCDDEEVLEEFTEAARAEGHTVEPAGPDKTVLITPKDTCPLMCEDCKILPKGVRARLISAQTVTMSELRRYRFAHDSPDLAEHFAGRIRITAEVVTSSNPTAEVGDTATMMIKDPGSGARGIADLVRGCPGPRWFISLRWLSFQRVCGCLGPQLRNDV